MTDGGWRIEKSISLGSVATAVSGVVALTTFWVAIQARVTAVEIAVNLMQGQDRRITILEERGRNTDNTLSEIKATTNKLDGKFDQILAKAKE